MFIELYYKLGGKKPFQIRHVSRRLYSGIVQVKNFAPL